MAFQMIAAPERRGRTSTGVGFTRSSVSLSAEVLTAWTRLGIKEPSHVQIGAVTSAGAEGVTFGILPCTEEAENAYKLRRQNEKSKSVQVSIPRVPSGDGETVGAHVAYLATLVGGEIEAATFGRYRFSIVDNKKDSSFGMVTIVLRSTK